MVGREISKRTRLTLIVWIKAVLLPSLSNIISKNLKFLFLELVACQMLIMIIDKRELSSDLTQRKAGGS